MNPEFLEKYSRFSEYLWLVVSIVCLGSGLYFMAIRQDNEQGMIMFLFTAVGVSMYSIRRVMRRKMERQRQQKKD